MRDELLNETLFLSLAHARAVIRAWADDYNTERPHSSLGYATPAAFAAEIALGALVHHNNRRSLEQIPFSTHRSRRPRSSWRTLLA